MIILLKLFIAHLIGDFILQPNAWVKEKEKQKAKSPRLYFHVLLHGFFSMLLLWDFSYWPMVLAIVLVHFIIDTLKLYLQKKKTKRAWFFVDQFLHLLSLGLIWYLFESPDIDFYQMAHSTELWINLTGVLFLTFPVGIIIAKILEPWSKNIPDDNDNSLSNAGKYIGILERLLTFIFIMSGHWEAVGFLIASKSIFRFGDLKESKDRKLTEYILIGTLISFGISIVVGLLVGSLVNL